MSRWQSVPIEELCVRVTSGGTPSRKNPAYYESGPDGIPWVKSKELLDGSIWETEERISKDGLAKSSAKLLPRDTVLLAMYGANVGRLGRLRVGATVNQAICAMVVDSDVADPRFVFYALMNARSELVSQAHGAAQQNLSQQLIKPFSLRIPDVDTQYAIGETLGALDDLIENNRQRIELLESMARAIYREWFVHFRFPGHENVPMVDSDLGPIPEGWRTPQLRELVSTQYGYTESAVDEPLGPRYLRGKDINKRSWIEWPTVPYCPIDGALMTKFRIEPDDVFMIRMADPGKVGICEQKVDAVFASYLVRLRPTTDNLLPYFLFYTLTADQYQNWVTGASTGATRKSVSAKVMTEPRIALPAPSLQRSFDAVVRPIRARMTSLVDQDASLSSLRDLLLPKLVTGQLDVSTLDLDAVIHEAVA